MRSVFLFFALVVCLAVLWIWLPAEVRKAIRQTARKFFPAVLIAAAITIALLAFAFIFNGKVI